MVPIGPPRRCEGRFWKPGRASPKNLARAGLRVAGAPRDQYGDAMRNDPYAKDGHAFDGEPERTSAMAIASLATSIGCCIPGVGLLAALMGVISLGLIGQSHGRLSGRAPAAVAIMLGLIGTVIWGAIGAGGLQAWTFYKKQMAPVADRALMAAAAGDIVALRAEMNPDAAGDFDEARVRFFIETIEAEQGAIEGTVTDLHTTFQAFGRIYSGNRPQPGPGPGGPGDFVPVPVTLRCAGGDVLAWPVFDKGGFGSGTVRLVDILVQMPDMEAVALREDGPAASFAPSLGWTLIEPPGASAPPPADAPDTPPGR